MFDETVISYFNDHDMYSYFISRLILVINPAIDPPFFWKNVWCSLGHSWGHVKLPSSIFNLHIWKESGKARNWKENWNMSKKNEKKSCFLLTEVEKIKKRVTKCRTIKPFHSGQKTHQHLVCPCFSAFSWRQTWHSRKKIKKANSFTEHWTGSNCGSKKSTYPC